MSEKSSRIDFGGARASNTGDQFHELWATRQAMKLLDSSCGLTAISVEGMTVNEGRDRAWDGVDCAAFYGGESAAAAERIEIQQMKYSVADADKPWTVARLATGRNSKVTTSPIARLAQAYRRLIQARFGRPADTVGISLITNQPVAQEVIDAIEAARKDVPEDYVKRWKKGDPDLHRLVHASGLDGHEFRQFAMVLDLQGSSGSRFQIEDETLKAIAAWSDTEFVESAAQLRAYIRGRMMPDAAGEVITRENVLVGLGVSEGRALFPCPAKIREIGAPVPRAIAQTITDQLRAGRQYVCVHGSGGAGKTTLLQEIESLLPPDSVMLKFDCYGGGSYLDASALRHRPRDAFLQLANELARRLRLPMLVPPRLTEDYPRLFRRRLDHAASAMARVRPSALLVVAIDAADNSVTAGQSRTPQEHSFVHDLMTFEDLPTNTRIVISARTGRLAELALPSTFERITLPAFDRSETGLNVSRFWNTAPSDWVDDFHHLSGGVPRVQAYAFESAGSSPEKAIDALRPVGKKLDQIFSERFQLALKKAGRSGELQLLCAGLITLPRPIPVEDLAAVLPASTTQIVDVCNDLAPGVRLQGDLISFADEDFEVFVRTEAGDAVSDVLERAADRLYAGAATSAYAALNIAHILLAAGRGAALLNLVEQAPEPPVAVMPDPVRRHEVLVQRLQAAIKVCRDAGETARALRFVLIGAEAKGADNATRSLMTNYPGLAVKYASETASRLILGDPEAVPNHGPLLFHMIGEAAVRGDGISVREDRRRLKAWLDARNNDYRAKAKTNAYTKHWPISPEDGAASVYATIILEGIDATLARYSGARPDAFGLSLLSKVVSRLLAEGRPELVEEFATKLRPAWAVFVYVPLAMAGKMVDHARLAKGLATLKRRFHLNACWLRKAENGDQSRPAVIDVALSAAEILVAAGAASPISEAVFSSFRDPNVRRRDRLHEFDAALLDAILRSCTLADAIEGSQSTVDTILVPRPPPSDDKHSPRSDEERNDRRLEEVIRCVLSLYTLRAKTLSAGRPGADFSENLTGAQRHFEAERWRIENRPTAFDIRIKASESLAVLLATGADPAAVMTTAVELRSGWASYNRLAPARLFERLAALPSLHPALAQDLTLAAQKMKDARIGAVEKTECLAALAQFLAIVSSDDAKVVFRDAVNAASEPDSEIAHQLRLVGELTVRGLPAFTDRSRSCARALAEVVHDAAVRLEHSDFRWSEAFAAIARLDLPLALAAAARWSDTNYARLSDSLRPITTVGLDQHQLTVADTAALFGLLPKPGCDDLEAFIERAGNDGPAMAARIAEELAHDLLVDRIDGFGALSTFISRYGQGTSASRVAVQSSFSEALKSSPEGDVDPRLGEPAPLPDRSHDILERQVWPLQDIVDASRLADLFADVRARLRESKQSPSSKAIYKAARDAVPFANRVDHLNALAGMCGRGDVVTPLLAALHEWSAQLAVKQWAIDKLPALIVDELPDFVVDLPWEDKRLTPAFAFAQIDGDQIQALLLGGIARHADDLGPQITFALVGVIGAHLRPSEAAELAQWYIDRLKARIPSIHLEGPPDTELPKDITEVLGRFIYAHLSDVDVRVRWRAAHSLRRLARCGRADILAAVVSQAERVTDVAFRDPSAPFYALAARLWLVIALYRIAEETPMAAAPHGAFLLRIALDDRLPHVLIRSYASHACQKLVEAAHLDLTTEQIAALGAVNEGTLPRAADKVQHQRRGLHWTTAPGSRFRFDSMDTLPYWFEPWIDVFAGLTHEDFEREAERWIVDEWGIRDDPPYGSKEPRARRFNDRDYNLTSHRHGSEPVKELHRRYLEWHAMWCTVGTLLGTHRLAPIEEWGEDRFSSRMEQSKLTLPPVWLADLVGPTPLETRYWKQDRPPGPNWLQAVANEGFLMELRATNHPDYLVVDASTDVKWSTFEQSTRVSTGLVSPETAHALARALQSYDNSFDYYICPEGNDSEIDDGEFRLKGWLTHPRNGPGFDKADVYRNGVRCIEAAPGDTLTKWLRLEQRFAPVVGWWRPGAERPALIYEEWGMRERDDEDRRSYGAGVTSRGHRLLIRQEDLQAFLVEQSLDLIAEVEITRRERRAGSSAFDEEAEKNATFDRLVLLRGDGQLEAAERDLGTWRTDRS